MKMKTFAGEYPALAGALVILAGDGAGLDWKNRSSGVRIALRTAGGNFGARRLPAQKLLRDESGSGIDWTGTVVHSMSRRDLLEAIYEWLKSDAFLVRVTTNPAVVAEVGRVFADVAEDVARLWNSTIGLRGNRAYDDEQIELCSVRGPF